MKVIEIIPLEVFIENEIIYSDSQWQILTIFGTFL